MIVTKTPFRISFLGGGSDLPSFFQNHGGCVVTSSLDKFIYLSINNHFEEKGFNLKYSKNELATSINEIKHPIIKKVFSIYKINDVVLSSIADLPANTGMGSSSAFTVGLINLCNYFSKKKLLSKSSLAEAACNVEIKSLKEPIGKQDQYASSFGGFNKIIFNKDNSVEVIPMKMRGCLNELNENLLLFYLGGKRKASSVLKEQNEKIKKNLTAIDSTKKIMKLAEEFKETEIKKNLDLFGELLDTNWILKRSITNKISNPFIDEFYETAKKNGAIGGKLLGAGSGGFFLVYARKKDHSKLKRKLGKYKFIKFSFGSNGSKLIKI